MDEIVYGLDGAGYVTVLIHVTENDWEVLLDRNNHVQFYCSSYTRLLLLFTIYMITVDCYTVLLLSLYHPSILGNMDIDCFN